MVFTASRFGIEQIYAAFLAAGDHQFTTLIVEDRRSNLHIEIALLQPDPIRGYVPIFELQLAALDSRANQTVAVYMVLGIVPTVSSGSPGGSARVNRRPGPAPQAAATGIECHHLLPRIGNVERPYLVWISSAAL